MGYVPKATTIPESVIPNAQNSSFHDEVEFLRNLAKAKLKEIEDYKALLTSPQRDKQKDLEHLRRHISADIAHKIEHKAAAHLEQYSVDIERLRQENRELTAQNELLIMDIMKKKNRDLELREFEAKDLDKMVAHQVYTMESSGTSAVEAELKFREAEVKALKNSIQQLQGMIKTKDEEIKQREIQMSVTRANRESMFSDKLTRQLELDLSNLRIFQLKAREDLEKANRELRAKVDDLQKRYEEEVKIKEKVLVDANGSSWLIR